MGRARLQLHLPNLYVGGIERWALTLMNGLPEFDWFVSTPSDALSHGSGIEAFRPFPRVDEQGSGIAMDALITTWGTSNRGVTPTIAVAHSAFPLYRAMMREVRCDAAVAVSHQARDCFADPDAVTVIDNGVDLDRLKPTRPKGAVRAELGIGQEAVVIGYVGRWGYQKNPLAAAMAASGIDGAVALYVGPPSEDAALVAEARRLAPCRFVPPEAAEAIGDLYAAMDVCVFASRTEGFGLAIAEAWRCGVPVVATAVGVVAAHPELVTLLPQEPDAAQLKAAVEQALWTPSETLRRAEAMVLHRYSAQGMVSAWRDFILAHLADGPAAGR